MMLNSSNYLSFYAAITVIAKAIKCNPINNIKKIIISVYFLSQFYLYDWFVNTKSTKNNNIVGE